jgi:hypothetical protein
MKADYRTFHTQLLWAQALDDGTTALVVGFGGKMLGGVAHLVQMNHEIHWSPSYSTMDLGFQWVWWRYVDSAEQFRESKEWAKRELAQTKMLEAPR